MTDSFLNHTYNFASVFDLITLIIIQHLMFPKLKVLLLVSCAAPHEWIQPHPAPAAHIVHKLFSLASIFLAVTSVYPGPRRRPLKILPVFWNVCLIKQTKVSVADGGIWKTDNSMRRTMSCEFHCISSESPSSKNLQAVIQKSLCRARDQHSSGTSMLNAG